MLLCLIYIAYIGLGIPDALFGAAWPLFHAEFGLPESVADLVFLPLSVGTVLSAVFAGRLIRLFGTGKLTAVSTALTAAGLFLFSAAKSPAALLLAAIPLGLGAGAVDTALNEYVLRRFGAKHLHFLHCFYGIGVSLSPALLAVLLSRGGSWRDGYRLASLLQAAVAALTVCGLPLWRSARSDGETLDLQEAGKPRKAMSAYLAIAGAAGGIEYAAGLWGSTYLRDLGFAADTAAAAAAGFYAAMAAARFLAGIGIRRIPPRRQIGFSVCGLGVAGFLFCLSAEAQPIALLVAGFSVAPVFPNVLALAEGGASGGLVAASYLGITLGPTVFGRCFAIWGIRILPSYLLLLTDVLLVSLVRIAARKH